MSKRTPEEVQQILTEKIVALKKELRRCMAAGGDELRRCLICGVAASAHIITIDEQPRTLYVVEQHTATCALQKALQL